MISAKTLRVKLTQVANQKSTTYQNIHTLFLIERMLVRLMQKQELIDKLVFKGGYVALRIFESPRYTIDLDASIKNADVNNIAFLAKEAIEKDIGDNAWFRYEKEQSLETLGEYGGLRLYFRAGIGDIPKKILKSQSIHLDLGIGDSLIPQPVKTKTPTILNNEEITWQVYSIELASAEKLHTLIVRGSENSRAKDVFDLYHFLQKCNIKVLKKALVNTFKTRGDKLPNNILSAIKSIDTSQLKRGWISAIASFDKNLDFEMVFNKITKLIEKL